MFVCRGFKVQDTPGIIIQTLCGSAEVSYASGKLPEQMKRLGELKEGKGYDLKPCMQSEREVLKEAR